AGAPRAGGGGGRAPRLGSVRGLPSFAYAPMLPQLATVGEGHGRRRPVREWTRVSWTTGELAAGLATAFDGNALAIGAGLLGAVGLWRLTRRDPILGELFALPPLVTVGALVASGHHLWPRFLFFAIPFGA